MKPRALNSASYSEKTGKYPFVLNENLQVYLGLGHLGRHVFSSNGTVLGDLTDDVLTIYRGYASDGASPCIFRIGRFRLGTPSHRKIAEAWFTHDFLYQFGRLVCSPWTYRKADQILYDIMRQKGSILAALYYSAVVTFGGLHRHVTKKPNTEIACLVCRESHPAERETIMAMQ